MQQQQQQQPPPAAAAVLFVTSYFHFRGFRSSRSFLSAVQRYKNPSQTSGSMRTAQTTAVLQTTTTVFQQHSKRKQQTRVRIAL